MVTTAEEIHQPLQTLARSLEDRGVLTTSLAKERVLMASPHMAERVPVKIQTWMMSIWELEEVQGILMARGRIHSLEDLIQMDAGKPQQIRTVFMDYFLMA